jgi:hypothetical protein
MKAVRVLLRVATGIWQGRRGAPLAAEPAPREKTPPQELRIEELEERTPASPMEGS